MMSLCALGQKTAKKKRNKREKALYHSGGGVCDNTLGTISSMEPPRFRDKGSRLKGNGEERERSGEMSLPIPPRC